MSITAFGIANLLPRISLQPSVVPAMVIFASVNRLLISLTHILIETDFCLTHPNQLELRCTLRIQSRKRLFSPIIVAHGFRGFKDWGFLPYLSRQLTQSGFAAISFNHSLSGIGDNPWAIEDLEGFSHNSTSQELQDWNLLLDSLLWGKIPFAHRLRLNSVGVVGHSRGGSYGILLSSQVPQIRSVVTWGAIQSFDRFDGETRRRWQSHGYLEVNQQPQEKPLRLKVGALDALDRNLEQLDVLKAMRQSSIPVLILHTRQDRTVPLIEGQNLWQCADQKLSNFQVIEGGGHTFQTQHPLDTPSLPLLEAVSRTIEWFKKSLPT